MEEKLNLTISEKQRLLFNDVSSPNVPEIYVEGSVQSGKTFIICLSVIAYARNLYKYSPNENYYGAIIGWSVDTLKGNIVDVIEQDLNKLGLKNRAKNKGQGDYDLKFGSSEKILEIYNLKIYFFGFNNSLSFNKILGRPLIFIWCDESARIYSQNTLRESFDELNGRQVSYVTNPFIKTIHSFNVEGNTNHPYKLKYLNGKPNAKHYTFFPYDNPKLNTEEAMLEVKNMFPDGSALQRQKIFNEWCVAEGKVFNKLNIIDNLDDFILREIGLGDDYGSVNPTTFVPIVLAYNTKSNKWCLVRLPVYYHNPSINGDTPTTEFYSNQLRMFMLYLKEHYDRVPLTTNVIDSEAAHFKNRLEVDNIPFSESDKSDGVSEGVEHLQALIDKEYFYILKGNSITRFRDDGTPEFSDKDESLIEFESYQYDTIRSINTGQNCYKKELDHSIDGSRYLIKEWVNTGRCPQV